MRATTVSAKRLLAVNEAAELLRVSVAWTRQLIATGKLDSTLVGSRRYVPATALDEYLTRQGERREALLQAAPKEWDWEGNLVEALAQWLREQGWEEVSRASAALREHGIDLVVRKDGRTRVIEVKGWPSAKHRSGAKLGQAKKWRSTMGRNYVGDLVLSAMLLRSSRPDDEVAIAVPARETFRNLLTGIRSSLELLGVGAYLVQETGDVTTFLDIDDVDHGREARDRAIDRAFVRRLLRMSDIERERHYVDWNRTAMAMVADARRGG